MAAGHGQPGQDRRPRAELRPRPRLELDRAEDHSTPRGDTWVLKGVKRWIGNGTIADLIVARARHTLEGQVNGFMVETPAQGYEALVITRKVSLP